MRNDKLNLLYLMNRNAKVAVKTPFGSTDRVTIRKVVMQGTVWGSLMCTSTMDQLPKSAYTSPEDLYKYKVVAIHGCHYLLRGNIKVSDPQINLLININTRDDEKRSGSSCTARQETTKTENNQPLMFLSIFD